MGAVLQRLGMVSREKADSVVADFAPFAHGGLKPHEVPDALVEFGVAVPAHGDDVDFLDESYTSILEQAAAMTDGAVTITDVRLREDEEYDEVLEFRRNGVLVTEPTEHESEDYLDHMAVGEAIRHVDPDPEDDTRRFYLVEFVRLKDTNYDSHYVFASPEQKAALERELGVHLL